MTAVLRRPSRTEKLALVPQRAPRVPQPPSRRWRRCTVTIETPTPARSRPMPIIQRRSRPVNGSVPDLAVSLEGEVLELGLVLGVVFVSVVGDVPLFSFSAVVGVV